MRAASFALAIAMLLFIRPYLKAQVIPGFTAPDTVCINAPITLNNTTTGATSYFWNFCTANLNNGPTGANLGNLGALNTPVYIDYVFTNGNYYGFSTNNVPGKLIRLDFGNSLLNTPVATDMGTFGNIVPNHCEGLQIVNDNGQWYVIIVGGDAAGTTAPRLVRITLGSSITNPSPTATNFGNIGSMSYPHDLYVFEDGGNWYGLTVNTTNNTITRFNFTSSFANTPSAVNIGNIGNLNGPTGIYAMKENNNWYAFVTNAFGNTITRLDFGTSLLNLPTGVNLGSLGGAMSTPWDIYIINYCGEKAGFLINAGNNSLVKLNFGNSVTNTPTVLNYGTMGGMNFPHCLSKLFRVGPDLYTFVTNVNNNSLTRIRFTGCTNSTIPSSTLQNPGVISYNLPGTYNINLTVDDGLPTQASYCQQVVVLPLPIAPQLPDAMICPGGSYQYTPPINLSYTYSWTPSAGLSNSNFPVPVASPSTTTQYILTVTNSAGCSNRDTSLLTVLTPAECNQTTVVPSFSAPDTVCVNAAVSLQNNSTGASSYFWNFCNANLSAPPVGNNLGTLGGTLNTPVYVDYVLENGNYYGFSTNNFPGKLLRLDFGNSLLNTPVVTDLGTLGNIIPNHAEGLQIVKNGGLWYVMVVGGDASGTMPPRLVRVALGPTLTNNAPVATNFGNIGGMSYPHDLFMFQDGVNWYGLTVNTTNNTITRINFTSSLANTPTAINLGNIGSLNGPTGIYALKEGNNWIAFVTNHLGNSVTRLNFGTSLLNTPAGVNLGNIGNLLSTPFDIQIINYCGQKTGFIVNTGSVGLIRLDFNGSLLNTPSAVNLGNIGSMSFPHSLSKLFRVGADLYTFTANVTNNSMTRLRFTGCNNSSLPNSSLQNPGAITYTVPGVYNINLTVDDGLPTQSVYCRQVVVLPAPVHMPVQNYTICQGDSLKIGVSPGSFSFVWNTGATTDSIYVFQSGTYWIEKNSFQCSVRDSFIVTTINPVKPDFSYVNHPCNPLSVQFYHSLPANQNFTWSFGNGQLNSSSSTVSETYSSTGIYTVKLLTGLNVGCKDSVVKNISLNPQFDTVLVSTHDTLICVGDSVLLGSNLAMSQFCWNATNGTVPSAISSFVKPLNPVTYTMTADVRLQNLVTNGDFSQGNSGFTSQYSFANNSTTPGQYWVGSNPQLWNPTLPACFDHSGGGGNFMMLSGFTVPGVNAWSESLVIAPNKTYNFSVWVTGITAANSTQMKLEINGVLITPQFIVPTNPCQWTELSTKWNSGTANSVNLSLITFSSLQSNFGIDDIYFGEVLTRTDSVRINVGGYCDSIKIIGDSKICNLTDTFSYSIFRSANCNEPFLITADNNVVDIVSQTATILKLRFKQPGQTILKVSFPNACKTIVDSLAISVTQSPQLVDLGPDVALCRDTILNLNAGPGYSSYMWQDGSTNATYQVTVPGTYFIEATDACGKKFRDTVIYTKDVLTLFGVSPSSAIVCSGDSVSFAAYGGTFYEWQPVSMFDNPGSATTKALVATDASYSVKITDPVCKRDSIIIIPVATHPSLDLVISKSNDVNCTVDSSVLQVTGGSNYQWTPHMSILRNQGKQITVKPLVSTKYYVTATDNFGCVYEDSVLVNHSNTGDQKLLIPNAFTPNGDGKNDVFRPRFSGPSKNYQFSIFNRWGELVFRTRSPMDGWDGFFRSVPQPAGVYVFHLKAEGECNGLFEEKGTFVLIR